MLGATIWPSPEANAAASRFRARSTVQRELRADPTLAADMSPSSSPQGAPRVQRGMAWKTRKQLEQLEEQLSDVADLDDWKPAKKKGKEPSGDGDA